MQNSNKPAKFRPSICLVKAISKIKNDSTAVLNTLYDNACRYAIKAHPLKKSLVTEKEMIEIDGLRESTLYVRFQQLKQHFSWAL